MDLSILIPARNEEWLEHTIKDVFKHSRADTEVIVALDGEWPRTPLFDHERLRVTHSKAVIGQRAAVNLAAQMSRAKYVMKLDAHCSLAEGFDRVLIDSAKELGPTVTQIPQMRNLQAFWRFCKACNNRVYQGPLNAVCEACKSTAGFRKEIVWEPRRGTRTECWRFDHTLHFQYWNDGSKRPEFKGDISDVMTSVGACFFMERERFIALGGLDERHGSWGNFGIEIACKSWLSGGRHVVNKKTYFCHLFRTQGADFGFPYPMSNAAQDKARTHSRDLWLNNKWQGQVRPLSWLIEKFSPLPDWHDPIGKDALAAVNAAGSLFAANRQASEMIVSTDRVPAALVGGMLEQGQADSASARADVGAGR